MDAERWRRIESLFYSALERPEDERGAFLAEACSGSEDLRREVESLVSQHERGSPMATTVAGRPEEPPDLPRAIGRFRVLSRLGSGGMGEVWLAEDEKLGRKVALKLLPDELSFDEARRRRLEREARAASALNHPGILTIYDIDQAEGRHFIASEYVDGETLRGLILGRQAGMEPTRALEIASQIASALGAAHEAGIVHRDVKPENIVVRPDGLVKILDFGLAKGVEAGGGGRDKALTDTGHTAPGIVLGTAAYMSPEQARGLDVDARTDIFSLGVVLYEMLAGRAPFTGETRSDVIASTLTAAPRSLTECVPGVAPELANVVDRALQKDRSARYQSVLDMHQDLESLRAAGPSPLGERRPPRRRAAIYSVLALLLGLAGAGYWLSRSRSTIDSIAVLPFENASGDPDLDYLADGIPETLLNRFAPISSLRVLPRSTVVRHKGDGLDPVQIGHTLGVGAVLTGRVSQRGNAVRVQVDLVDVERRAQIWGEQYDRRASDMLAVQEQIARKVLDELRLEPTQAEAGQIAKAYTKDAQGYPLYIRARHLAEKGDPQSLWRAIELFKEVIARDPDFALAYADIAFIYTALDSVGAISGSEAAREAKAYATQALARDDRLAEAHAYLADISYIYEWDWTGAEREYLRALDLDPISGKVHRSYAIYLVCLRRFEEAIREMGRALELEPVSALFNRGMTSVYYFARSYDQAIEQGLLTLELDENNVHAYHRLTDVYVQSGRLDDSVSIFLKGVPLTANPDAAKALKEAYASSGWKGYQQNRLELNLGAADRGYISPYFVAASYLHLGQKEEAFVWLEKAIQDRDDYVTFYGVEPLLDGLRSDPRFKDMLRRIGLAE